MLAGDPPAGLLQSLTPSTFGPTPAIPVARSLVKIACIVVPSGSLSHPKIATRVKSAEKVASVSGAGASHQDR